MTEEKNLTENEKKSLSFVEQMVEGDLAAGKNGMQRLPEKPGAVPISMMRIPARLPCLACC